VAPGLGCSAGQLLEREELDAEAEQVECRHAGPQPVLGAPGHLGKCTAARIHHFHLQTK